MAVNHQDLTTLEPVFFDNTIANYKYNNNSLEVLGLFEINFNNKIDDMRRNIRESLNRLVVSLNIRKTDLQQQVKLVSGKLNEIPKQNKDLNIIGMMWKK